MVVGLSYVGDGRGPVMGGSAGTAQSIGIRIMSKAKSWFSGFSKVVKSIVSPVARPQNTVAGVNAYVDVTEMALGGMEGEEVSGGHRIGVTTVQDAVNSDYKPELPDFSGKEDWQGYYSMFCATADLAQWNDNRRFVELWLKLQGEAAEVCAEVFSQPGLPTFQALAIALRDRFESSGKDMVPVERVKCDESLMTAKVVRGRAKKRGRVADGGLRNRKTVQCVQDMQHVSNPGCFVWENRLNGERPSGRGRGRGSLSRPRGDREGGRGWPGSVQEEEQEGLGQWPTPENTIHEEN